MPAPIVDIAKGLTNAQAAALLAGTAPAASGTDPGFVSAATQAAHDLLAAEYAAGLDLCAQQVRALKALAGITTAPTVCFDDFVLTQLNSKPLGENTVSGTGTGSVVAGVQSAFQLSSGATAGGVAHCRPSTAPFLGVNPGSGRWGYSTRFAVTTAVDAETIASDGISDIAGNFVRVGVHGAVSTTNFTAQVGSATIDSGVAIDTDPHTFVLYRAAGNVYLMIDGVARGNAAFAGAWTALPVIIHYIDNGGTAAARTMQIRWFCGVGESL